MNSRRFVLLLLFIFLLSSKPTKSFSWDPLNISENIAKVKEMINEAIDKVFEGASELVYKTKEAVKDVLDKLFDEKLAKLLYQIQAMIEENLRQISAEIQEIINKFFDRVHDLVDQVAKRAKELIGQTIEDIKNKIIDEFFHKAEILAQEVTADVIKILNIIDKQIFEIYCSAVDIIDRVIGVLIKSLPWIPNPWDKCRNKLADKLNRPELNYKLFSSFTDNELYSYRKCDLFINFTETTPIESILMAYRDLENLAGGMRCTAVARRTTENLYYFLDEMADCVRKSEMYKKLLPKMVKALPSDRVNFLG